MVGEKERVSKEFRSGLDVKGREGRGEEGEEGGWLTCSVGVEPGKHERPRR